MPVQKGFFHFLTVTLRVYLKDACGIYCHRRIHISWYGRNFPLVYQKMEVIDDFLGALNGKRRNYDFTLTVDCPADNLPQFFHGNFRAFVLAVAVGTFHKDVIWCRHLNAWVADNWF